MEGGIRTVGATETGRKIGQDRITAKNREGNNANATIKRPVTKEKRKRRS